MNIKKSALTLDNCRISLTSEEGGQMPQQCDMHVKVHYLCNRGPYDSDVFDGRFYVGLMQNKDMC